MLKFIFLLLFLSSPLFARIARIDNILPCATPIAASRYSLMIKSNRVLYANYQMVLERSNEYLQRLLPLLGGDATESGRSIMKFEQVPELFRLFANSIFGDGDEKLLHVVGSGDYVRNTLTSTLSFLNSLIEDPRLKKQSAPIRLIVKDLLTILSIISLDITILRDLYEQPTDGTCEISTQLDQMGFTKSKPRTSYTRTVELPATPALPGESAH